MKQSAPRPVWEPALAKAVRGKVLLVGITYLSAEGQLLEQQQFFGKVASANSKRGVLLSLLGTRAGEQYNLPPDTRSINPASPGVYRLRASGEEVVNPDFTVTFEVRKQAKQ
jgi:hypothetical protein